MVALELPVYQQLRGYRRQVGAHQVRMRELRRELELFNAYLDELTRRAQALPAYAGCQGRECRAADLACPRGLMLAALAERPGRRCL